MRRPYLIAAGILGVLSFALIAISLSVYIERPTVLRVAVSASEPDDIDLVNAMAKLAKRERKGLRIKPVTTPGIEQAARALEQDQVDVAVVRPDVAMPDKGKTVVLLHKDVAIFAAPGGSEIEKVSDLAGKKLGIVNPHPGDDKLLESALNQYDIESSAVTTVPLAPDGVEAAMRDKSVDAIYTVGQASSAPVQKAVRALAKSGEGPPVILPVAEAAAIADRLPAYESVEVVKGTFGGTPPRPADDVDTLGVTTRLVASVDLSEGTVANLTRFLLSERVALAELAPVARRMTAPSTDKGAVLPVHPGAADYLDDEEETFLDRYSDFIYIGAMVLGVFASGLTAVVGRFGAAGAVPVEEFIARLLAILKQARAASHPAVLDQLETEVDTVVAEALGSLRGLDERKAAALGMAVDQARAAIAQRRHALNAGSAQVEATGRAFEPILLTRRGGGTLGDLKPEG